MSGTCWHLQCALGDHGMDARLHETGAGKTFRAPLDDPTPIVPADEVTQAFAVLRRHLPASLRPAEAELEAAWFNGGPLPIDWPDRFRKADEACVHMGWGHETHLVEVAEDLQRLPAHVVEAIIRELLGEGE